MPIIWIAVRVIAAFGSVPFFYLACLVYEDKEKAYQSKLETLWVQFDDLRAKMVTRNAAFVAVVAGRTKDFLNRVFPGPILSMGSVHAAVILCVGSYCLLGAAASFLWLPSQTGLGLFALRFGIAFGLACIMCCITPAIFPKTRWFQSAMVYSFALFWALGWLGLYFYAPRHSAFREAASPWNFIVPMVGFPVGVALGTCLTLLSVIIGRRSLAAAEEQPSEGRISNGIVIGLTGVGLLFLSAMVWYAHSHRLSFPFALFLNGLFGVFICSAVVLTGCLLVAVTIACLMFIDRMFWPLMSRLLYRLPRHRFVENKRVLAGIATVLVVFAITGNYDWHILQKLMLGW